MLTECTRVPARPRAEEERGVGYRFCPGGPHRLEEKAGSSIIRALWMASINVEREIVQTKEWCAGREEGIRKVVRKLAMNDLE